MNTHTLIQTILWRRLDSPGHDACGLWSSDYGWQLVGTAVFRAEEQPCHLSYEVHCDASWSTRLASVTGWLGKTPVNITLEVISDERWMLNGHEQGEELRGLIDVDLGFTPSTNLIQLRRLSLNVGDEAEAPVAYFHFPELTLGRLEHRYRRIALDQYDYQAPTFGYSATLQVSGLGFVTQYPGLWALEALQ